MCKDYTEEQLYNICKEMNFDKEQIIYFLRKNGIDLRIFQNKISNYSRFNIYHNRLTDMKDEELLFTQGNEIALLIKTYKKFIEERKIEFKKTSSKGFVKEIKEALLQFFIQVKYNKEIIQKKFIEWELDFDKNIELIARYALNEKRDTAWNKEKVLKCFSTLTNKKIETIDELLENVLNESKEENFINLLENSIQDLSVNKISNFIYTHHMDNVEKVRNNLKEKFKIYMNYKKQKKEKNTNQKQKKLLETAKKIIHFYIEHDYSNIDDFITKQNISIKEFNSYLNIIKSYDKELFMRYIEKSELIKQRNYILIFKACKKIVDGIQNGVLENGQMRPFDLLDYYLTTTLDKRIILRFLKEHYPNDVVVFTKFFRQYTNATLLDSKKIQYLYNKKELVDVEFDNKGHIIPFTGREVTKEEKMFVINYLKENNIPLYDIIYYIALKRYLEKTLILEENTQKKKTFDK